MKYFRLTTTTSIAPGQGEDLGVALANAALARETELRAGPGSVEYWAGTVAQMLYLAADAFSSGASASMGHNRADRYEQRAKELRDRADQLYAEGRKAHDVRENAVFQEAFACGYDDTNRSSIGKYNFDRREAYLIGEYYGQRSLPVPGHMRSVYEGREHWMEADGKRFRVDYPNGKVAEAVVEPLA